MVTRQAPLESSCTLKIRQLHPYLRHPPCNHDGIAHHFEPDIYGAGDFRLFRAFSFALTLIGVDLENQNVVAVLIAALVILLACLADSHCEWPS
jgi:hypothetical protein